MQEHSGQIRSTVSSGIQAVATTAAATHHDWRRALDAVLPELLAGRDRPPDLVVLFASTAYSGEYPDLVSAVFRRTEAACLIGGSARGVVSGDTSYETEPSLSLLALWLPGAVLTPVRLHQSMLDQLAAPDGPGSALGFPAPSATNGWLVVADPFRMDAQEAVTRLRTCYPAVPMMGALASTHAQDRKAWVFFDDHVYDEGGVALAIGGPYEIDVNISQGAEPIGKPWTISGVDRNRITSISNRPAAEMMYETLAEFPPEIRADVERNLMLGFPMDEYQDQFRRGEFVIRGLLDVDKDTGSLVVGSIPRVGQTVQFHLRDAVNAALDVQQMLVQMRDGVRGKEVVAGVMCTCRGRGEAMFGRPDHDASAVRDAFGRVPVAGVFSFGEIGPVCGVPALNSFAMVLGLIVRKGNTR